MQSEIQQLFSVFADDFFVGFPADGVGSDKPGEEIIRQFVEQGLTDNRTDLIAVIAPQYFDNSFKGTLRFLAKLGGKKVIFIELDDVARLVEGNHSITIPSA